MELRINRVQINRSQPVVKAGHLLTQACLPGIVLLSSASMAKTLIKLIWATPQKILDHGSTPDLLGKSVRL